MATVVKNGGGVLRLPPGFRFHPTDEELVVQYLRRKVYSCPLPASIIPEVDVCKSDPWDLPGNSEQERYFFSTREAKYPNGNRSNRATVSGYWKATGIGRQIAAAASAPVKGDQPSSQVVGMKKTLVFYKGKPPSGAKTDWIMHEYRLASTADSPDPSPQKMNLKKNPVVAMENWVLCRIFLKKRNTRNDEDDVNNRDGGGVVGVGRGKVRAVVAAEGPVRPAYYDFIMTRAAMVDGDPEEGNGRRVRRRYCLSDSNLMPASYSSGSSGITEVSPGKDNDDNNNNDSNSKEDDHEESSSNNSLQLFGGKP